MQDEQLEKLLKQTRLNVDIFHDLMEFKIREILLVATVYDAFIFEQDGRLSERVFGEYSHLNLSTAPRITAVSNGEEALGKLDKRRIDMVILTMRIDEMSPFDLAEKIKEKNPDLPVLLLLNDNTDISLLKDQHLNSPHIDDIFVWNGDSIIFLAMTKLIEDRLNVQKDTKLGAVRVVLLVEDSIRYYSRYLPILYTAIIKQTQILIGEEKLEDTNKVFRMRARPKILMAKTYEDAMEIYKKYQDNLLCLISDVRFPKEGKLDLGAGLSLIKNVLGRSAYLPTLLQSSNLHNKERAEKLGVKFIHKHSDTLGQELMDFFSYNLGFGDFVFRNLMGQEIARARSITEFGEKIQNIPEESLIYHAERNDFSTWMMARGEILFAKKLQPLNMRDFEDIHDMRDYLSEITQKIHYHKTKGKIVNFDENIIKHKSHITRLAKGSIGGKGRGLAFINTLIENTNLSKIYPNVEIKIPQTAVIGTQEYEEFMETNGMWEKVLHEKDYEKVKQMFLEGELSKDLIEKLRIFLGKIKYPIAVRSSSLFEDSLSQPFSGIYITFLLPNAHEEPQENLEEIMNAIKLVFASVFSRSSRQYFEAINYDIEEERMAVLLQEVVGDRYEQFFYPNISGVAQSFNFYPMSYLKPEEGLAVIGVGLGKYVIEGEKAFKFSPGRPQMDIQSPKGQMKDSQEFFYALDMKSKDIDLKTGETATLVKEKISDAENHGTLYCCASVWDYQNNRMMLGLDSAGPRVINFAYILKYDYFPLAQVLRSILTLGKYALGTHVEIEYAIRLNEDSSEVPYFYILQLKPLFGNFEDMDVLIEDTAKEELLLKTPNCMGNGVFDDATDIIYVDPEKFDKAYTQEMAREIEELNEELKKEGRRYVLIGPGRWGTSDRWLGIPVEWPQISSARVIVETAHKEMNVDASLGSHFFHNITSQNIGYLSIKKTTKKEFIDWDWLKDQKSHKSTNYFKWIRGDEPFQILIDGRHSQAVVKK